MGHDHHADPWLAPILGFHPRRRYEKQNHEVEIEFHLLLVEIRKSRRQAWRVNRIRSGNNEIPESCESAESGPE